MSKKMMKFLFLILIVISSGAFAQDAEPAPEVPTAADNSQAELRSAVEMVNSNLPAVAAGPAAIECELVPTSSDVARLSVVTETGSACSTQNVENDRLNVTPQAYTELPVGQHRLMTRDRNRFYQTGDFLLRRPSANNYQAVLNLNVTGANGLGEAMLNRIRGCMQQMNEHFKGPDGKQLEVVILTPQETAELTTIPQNQKPAVVDINVTPQPQDYRGNANEFGSNFTCNTIGHELLHHLGLCDEYHENPRDAATLVGNSGAAVNNAPNADQWSCRQVTTSSSYMRSITNAFNDVVPQNYTCSCDATCKTAIRLGSPYSSILFSQSLDGMVAAEGLGNICVQTPGTSNRGYPTGTFPENPENPVKFISQSGSEFQFETHTVNMLDEQTLTFSTTRRTCSCSADTTGRCTRMMTAIAQRSAQRRNVVTCPTGATPRPLRGPFIGNNGSTRVEGDNVIINTQGNGGSLLTPGQFNKVLSGTCTGGSPQYERCAAFSNISRTDPRCNVPPECNDDNYYLNNGAASVPAASPVVETPPANAPAAVAQ